MDGLNAGYAALLLEQYLDNPAAVPSEWRSLFESAPEELLAMQPGLARLLELQGNGHVEATAPAPAPVIVERVDAELAQGIASAMRLLNAFRSHGHLAARLDPLASAARRSA